MPISVELQWLTWCKNSGKSRRIQLLQLHIVSAHLAQSWKNYFDKVGGIDYRIINAERRMDKCVALDST